MNSSEVLEWSCTAAAAATLRRTIPQISSPRLDSSRRERANTLHTNFDKQMPDNERRYFSTIKMG